MTIDVSENFLSNWSEKIGFVTDVVWNHTASDSEWLSKNPEATYNLENTPYLTPAFVLDYEIGKLSQKLSNNEQDIFHDIKNENDLEALGIFLEENILRLRLEEFRQCNVGEKIAEFKSLLENVEITKEPLPKNPETHPNLELDKNSDDSKRFIRGVNLIDEFNRVLPIIKAGILSKNTACENLAKTLNWLNEIEMDKMNVIIKGAVRKVLKFEKIFKLTKKLFFVIFVFKILQKLYKRNRPLRTAPARWS